MINVIFGSSMGGFQFLKDARDIEIHYFCDNDPKKIGKKYFGIEVISPDQLDPNIHFVYICSIYYSDISKQLVCNGYTDDEYTVVTPSRDLFIPSKDAVQRFLKKCTQKGIDYCIIRNWENIFSDKYIGDVDIIIRDDHILPFKKLVYPFLSDNGIKIDLYSVYGTSGYRFNNMPYFPLGIANAFLKNFEYVNGVKVPSKPIELIGLLYHCLCYKGSSADIPIIIEDKSCVTKSLVGPTNDYGSKIRDIHSRLGGSENLDCLLDYYEYLCDNNFMPNFDVYRKTITDDDVRSYVQKYDKIFRNSEQKAIDYKLNEANNRYIMMFLRERVYENGIREALATILKQMYERVKLVYFKKLNFKERKVALSSVRGGNWMDDYGVSMNGAPVEIWILKNNAPEPLSNIQEKYFPFSLYDNTYFIKEQIRAALSDLIKFEDNLNVIHSTDDDLELVYYCDLFNIDLRSIIQVDR